MPGDEADLRRAIERLVDGQHEALGVVRAALERPDTPDEGVAIEIPYRETDERRFDLWVMRAHSREQMGEPRKPDRPDYSMFT